MGGYFALAAAAAAGADAVVAICPASAVGLAVGLRAQRFGFAADRAALTELLRDHDEREAIAALEIPVLLLHAEGDEVVPLELSRELAAAAATAELVVVPGGDHRSVQHDPALQAHAAAFLADALGR
jgi:pimeloyl-ACP methyl ester carboxylesterase